jgi:hypothetical protein
MSLSQLTGQIATLTRFVAKAAHMSHLLFKLLKKGNLEMHLTLGTKPLFKTIEVNFLVMRCTSACILGQTSLNAFGVVVATTHLAKKFPTKDL